MATDPLKSLKSLVTDAWQNLKTGLGDPRRDSRSYTVPVLNPLGFEALSILYRSSDIIGKVVDEPVRTAFRQGFTIKVADQASANGRKKTDKEAGEAIDAAIKKHRGANKLVDAMRWSRLYGGGALFVGANDGQTADRELSDRVKSIDFVTALNARECVPIDWYDVPTHPKYGQPLAYEIRRQSFRTYRASRPLGEDENVATIVQVHESRIIPIHGVRAENRPTGDWNFGWGDSLVQRVWEHVVDYDTAVASVATLLADYATPVMKIQGLAALMAADKDDTFKRRIDLIQLSKSVFRGVLVDAEHEDYSRNATSMSWVDSSLIQLANRVAASADYPVSLLFGQAPAGLNASGASDVRFWYDRIKALQTDVAIPALLRLAELICMAEDGPTGGVVPEDWQIVGNSLWQETDAEASARNLQQAQADQLYISNGVVSVDEIRQSRFGGDGSSTHTHIEDDSEIDSETDAATASAEVDTIRALTETVDPLSPAVDPKAQASKATALLDIVERIASGKVSRESGIEVLALSFALSPDEAAKLLGPETFAPTAPAPAPFGSKPK